jgi:hypothetical protein
MFPEDEALAARCQEMCQAAEQATGWVEANRELVRNEAGAIISDLNRAGRELRKLERAARRKMCVGVFGPSQAGKSYLISSLASGSDGRLLADFDGEQVDFLTQINPEGKKESTGLVTRFTLSQAQDHPDGFPVTLKLFSEMDIVKILANTYFEEFRHRQAPEPEELAGKVKALAAKAQPRPAGPLTRDDVADLRDYVNRNYGDKGRVHALRTAFWPQAVELAPRLSIQDRAQLYELIWEGAGRFTELYLELCTVLEGLGHAAEAFTSLEALLPRQTSIIDVATWTQPDQQPDRELTLTTGDGRRTSASHALITALTAELTIHLAHEPDRFFQHTDLLDFPGYRSRQIFEGEVADQLAKEGVFRECFLRGKVDHLFQHYSDERELTSMLLCVAPGPQEVQTLPRIINQWVESTHGPTPVKRTGKTPALFFVLTKFDLEFATDQGQVGSEVSRWSTRLHASLLDFFGTAYQWPREWDQEGPFRNLYLLRSVKADTRAYYDYDHNGLESALKEDQRAYLDGLREGFLQNQEVQAHFQDPARAWEELVRPGDGGISYLRESLRPVCNPELKRQQITASLQEESERLVPKLRNYYRSDDREQERRKKRRLAGELARLLAASAQSQRFGELLRLLQVADHELYDLYYQTETAPLAEEGGAAQEEGGAPPAQVSTVGEAASAADILGELFDPAEDQPQGPEEAPGQADGPSRALSEAGRHALAIERHWVDRMQEVADDPRLAAYFGFEPREFMALVHELAVGAGRLGLRRRLQEELEQATAFSNLRRDVRTWKQVGRAAVQVNSYVDWLGLDPKQTSEAQRTLELGGGRVRTVFQPRPPVQGYPAISERQPAYEQDLCTDWIAAFMGLVIQNADQAGEDGLDPEQNRKLGEIIQALEA